MSSGDQRRRSINWPDATCQSKYYIDLSDMVKIQDKQMNVANCEYSLQ